MANKVPTIVDIGTILAAGIDPKTGLPTKLMGDCDLKRNLKTNLRVKDEQDFLSRYKWYNLPKGINATLLERILYYKGRGILFYKESNNTFYFLPFALNGSIDVYGRYTGVSPLPFNGSTEDGQKAKPWIPGFVLEPAYDIVMPEDLKLADLTHKCVILNDYSQQISQSVIARSTLQDPLIDVMSDMLPFVRTNLLNGTGVSGMRVNNQDEQSNVFAANDLIYHAALEGKRWIALAGTQEFQELGTGIGAISAQEYLMALQSLDNLRMGLLGIDNNGVFSKSAHMLQDEQAANGMNASSVLNDGLRNRQEFCTIVNSIWGLGIWCELSEVSSGVDKNMDGELANDEDEKAPTAPTEETNDEKGQ